MLRIYLGEELRNSSSARTVSELKNILLRIFKRSYTPHGRGAYFDLQPQEKRLIENVGREKWDKIQDKLWDELYEINHTLVSADSTPERHYLFWTASHLQAILVEIERKVFLPNEDY